MTRPHGRPGARVAEFRARADGRMTHRGRRADTRRSEIRQRGRGAGGRVIRVVLVGLMLIVGFAGAAAAVDVNPLPCGDPDIPVMSRPGDGLAAALDSGPRQITAGDPFAAKPQVSIYEVHGYGPGLHDYAYQCDLVTDLTKPVASLLFSLTKIMVAIVVVLARVIFDPTFMALLAPVFQYASIMFGDKFFIPFIGMAVLATAVWMATRARRRIAENAGAAAGVVVVVTIALAAVVYPFTLGATIDKTMSGVVNTAASAITRTDESRSAADGLGSMLTKSLVYETWVTAHFGRGNTEAGRKYGPALWNASTLTRAEEAAITADPRQAEPIYTSKKATSARILEAVKNEYPSSYTYLAGDQGSARVGYTFVGWFAAISSMIVLGYALYRVIWALVFVRLAIAVTPLIAIAAQHPRWRWMLLTLLNTAGGVLVSGAAFAVIAIVLIGAGYAVLLSVEFGLPSVFAILAIGALNLTVWHLTKTLRRGGPIAQLRTITKRHAHRIPDLFPADKLPRPHEPAAPAESSMASTIIRGALIAGVGAATGGAAAAAATKIAATAAAPPAKTGRVIYTPPALHTTPAPQPPPSTGPTVVQGTVIPPEATHATTRPTPTRTATTGHATATHAGHDLVIYTPSARPVSPETIPARRALPAAPVTGDGVRLYTIGDRP
ncbi:MAG: hypothetical protein ACRC35_11290 [Angustibacter sp.]